MQIKRDNKTCKAEEYANIGFLQINWVHKTPDTSLLFDAYEVRG